ncbi:hypothetical protein CU254_25670 [Amycolatopsis sp. AA4]|uniref:hypothetical protein n=1 Tax=Actinomycetes TaxID=1760 RepID=UPI0001B54064|nr:MULTISPECIES: hypothetical protein [Actinomycetes]ATY13445.1 hypothetical protein CU254_25670 [Amycolatopsis sp. AA4]EFL09383.1 predicted protein [Streptomyces sp. AA4]
MAGYRVVDAEYVAVVQSVGFAVAGVVTVPATSWLAARSVELSEANAEIVRLTMHGERTRISRDPAGTSDDALGAWRSARSCWA